MKKAITLGLMRDLEKQVHLGEISYSRMVEILNEKKVTVWHTQFHKPEYSKDDESFSKQVLIYSPRLDIHSIGWFDFQHDKWTHIGDEEMADFVWCELEKPVKK